MELSPELKEYIIENKLAFYVKRVVTLKDGGTIHISCTNSKNFYIAKNSSTLHSEYPCTLVNELSNDLLLEFIKHQIYRLLKIKKDNLANEIGTLEYVINHRIKINK